MEEVTLYIKPRNKRIIREVFYISSPDHVKTFGCPSCKIWEKRQRLDPCDLCVKARIGLLNLNLLQRNNEGVSEAFSIMPKRFYVL